MQTNIGGYFHMARAALPHMDEGGSIINCGSETALFGSKQLLDYSATKGAIHAFTKSLAANLLDRGIRVNAVAPGPIESEGAAKQLWSSEAAVKEITDGVPLGRWGRTADIADAVSFLVSPHASYITGDVLTVDGGQWLNRGTYNFLTLPT